MRIFIFLLAVLMGWPSFSQRQWVEERSNEGSVLLMNFLYGGHLPAGDLADRFGGNFSAGLAVDWLTPKNFVLGLQSNLHFGTNVKENVIEQLRNEDGLIFGDHFELAQIKLRERGLYIGGHIGRIFRLGAEESRSGIRATLGAGFFQHKIRIQDDPLAFVSQLNDDYKKGYDRLANGLALTQFIGYHLLDKKRLVNFLAGFEFTQAFTESRRSFNFDTRTKEESGRLDLLFGFRVGWTLPLYIGENPDAIRY